MLKKIKRSYSNIAALLDYPRIHHELLKERKLFFFFYAWSFGGAERIHISILRLFKSLDPLCFITSKSINTGFKEEFESSSTVINLGRWSEKNTYKKHLYKKLANAINKQASPIVFGSNSVFMYELIPLLGPHVKIIDLLHNFADLKEGIEWHSLPCAPRIDKRIVLGQQLMEQLTELYFQNGISAAYLNRVEIIPNYVDANPSLLHKNFTGTLEVLFVARNSPEKRVNIFTAIANACQALALPLRFTMIGDFGDLENLPENTRLTGPVYDKVILNEYYRKSHFILLTSRREGLPLVIIEGMSFGVIPISTAVGELSTYISHKKNNGFLIENSVDDDQIIRMFIEKLEELLQDRSRLGQISQHAFATVSQDLSYEKFASAYRKTILE